MARVSVTLQLPEGPLRLQNVEFMIFNENMPEVLLSRPILVSLLLDRGANLARVRGKYHGQGFSAVGFNLNLTLGTNENVRKDRLARLTQKSIEYDHLLRFCTPKTTGT